MTSRGDWITLGVLGALTAGAALRGRRGGRAASLDHARSVWSSLLGREVRDLNQAQLDGLRKDRFLLEDGAPAEETDLLALEEVKRFRVRARSERRPTVLGRPVFHKHKIVLEDVRVPQDIGDAQTLPFVLKMWSSGSYEPHYFVVPWSVSVDWDSDVEEE